MLASMLKFSVGLVAAVRQLPTGGSGDEVDIMNADHIEGGEVVRCSVDGSDVWTKPEPSDGEIVSLWVRTGDKVDLFVFPFFSIKGTYSRIDDTSGELTVTSFQEDAQVPDDGKAMLEGAKKWTKNTKLTVRFDAASGTFTGENVEMVFRKVEVIKNEADIDGDSGDNDEAHATDEAEKETTKLAVQVLRVSKRKQVQIVGANTPEILIRLDHTTLFTAARAADTTVLLNVAEGKRLHAVLGNDKSVRCKFKMWVQPKTANGDRLKLCTMGGNDLLIMRSIPMEKYSGHESEFKFWDNWGLVA